MRKALELRVRFGVLAGSTNELQPLLPLTLGPFRVADDPIPAIGDEYDRDTDGRERGKVGERTAFDDFSEREKGAHDHEEPPDTALPAARWLKGAAEGHRVPSWHGRPAPATTSGPFSELGSELLRARQCSACWAHRYPGWDRVVLKFPARFRSACPEELFKPNRTCWWR